MKKIWFEEAWEEYLRWQTQDPKTLKRINKLLKDIARNGYNCIGKPEPLKHDLSGCWKMVRLKSSSAVRITVTNKIKL